MSQKHIIPDSPLEFVGETPDNTQEDARDGYDLSQKGTVAAVVSKRCERVLSVRNCDVNNAIAAPLEQPGAAYAKLIRNTNGYAKLIRKMLVNCWRVDRK